MSLRDLQIKKSYISYGEDNIATALITPGLREANVYKRSVGFFSSSVLDTILDGVLEFARNKGKIRLICSPNLNEDDILALKEGYRDREEIFLEATSRDFEKEIIEYEDVRLQLLEELVKKDILDVKIAVTERGMYHDKLGILEDENGYSVVFYGSPNSSKNGYKNNYEKIRVVRSWDSNSDEVIRDENEEFDSLWEEKNPFVEVYSFKKSAENSILRIKEFYESNRNKQIKNIVELRDYQKAAINAWIKNRYHGFFVMATGTGKTWTAIFAAKELTMKNPCMIVICAPYKHLVKQWSEDVKNAFPKGKIIQVSSENSKWEVQINEEIVRSKYEDNQIIVISTISSFKTERFGNTVKKFEGKKLLIVDEAHRFSNLNPELKKGYQYMLGLSATPHSGNSLEKGNELMKFFGGRVFNLPIEEALKQGFLVPYHYYPIYVHSTHSEEDRFRYFTSKMAACWKNGKCIDVDKYIKAKRSRLRVIAMAEEKKTRIDDILSNIKSKDHFVVYCGDGRLFDDRFGGDEELRHIQYVKKALNSMNYKPSQFTATENMYKRMELVDAFNKGEIDTLVAIRCLDEGINIPSIESALILASNDDFREFIQRRGRILRLYKEKKHADIYDVIVLPSLGEDIFAKIELRRFMEYSRLAINSDELIEKLDNLLSEYGLEYGDIKGLEEVLDEEDYDE